MVGALTIGGVALPEMLKLGYGKRLSSGVLAAGGTLSVLLPPSLILLFYGIVTDQSIGALFIAGVVPGLVLVTMFFIIVFIWGKVNPDDIPGHENSTPIPWLIAFSALLPITLVGLVITISIYAGIATPTEAAGVSAMFMLGLAYFFGGLRLKGLLEALKSTMQTMGYLGLLLSSGVLFGFVMTYHQIPQQFTELFVEMQLSPYAVLAMIIVFYIILGMFLEPVSMTFITLPTLYPLIHAAGFDLIWFGVVYTITMEIAVLTPPVGLNLFVIQNLARDKVTIGDVIIGCLPFIAALVVLLFVLIGMPDTALWLPELME
ncbi:C4-dicarboxylate ABC transporter permease [Enterovibrio norvegicus FF-162]|nr:TRAP transporter large permease [Enterovibrio norvegicus]OEE82037.1 C4-dicarboxylate ABC transporter permease [Enterovibrio norvegicus FF-162]